MVADVSAAGQRIGPAMTAVWVAAAQCINQAAWLRQTKADSKCHQKHAASATLACAATSSTRLQRLMVQSRLHRPGKSGIQYMYMPAFTSVQVVLDDRGWKGLVRAPLPVGQQLLLFAPRAGSRVMTRPRAP